MDCQNEVPYKAGYGFESEEELQSFIKFVREKRDWDKKNPYKERLETKGKRRNRQNERTLV